MALIDLGSEEVIEVKYNGQLYKLKEPTLKDASALQKKMKEDEEDQSVFTDFIVDLGLPRDIAEGLGVSKLKTLSEGILGAVDSK